MNKETIAPQFECKRCGKCCSNIGNLAIFEWEASNLAKHKVKIKPAIIAKVGDLQLILQWGLEGKAGKCPFLTSKGCKVYKDRPLVCRAFPFSSSGSEKLSGMISNECSSLIVPEAVDKTKDIFLYEVEQTYGDTYTAAQKLDAARIWISDLSRYAVRQLGKELEPFNGKEIGLLDLCVKGGLYTKKFIDRETKFFMR
jgi:Fe-S-cluster containining protein